MTIEKLQDIFRDVFNDDGIILSETTTSSDIDDWDSLAHIQLITEIEKSFGIRFTVQEAVSAENVKEFTELIDSKLQAKNKE
jgi:acyl carrier protein